MAKFNEALRAKVFAAYKETRESHTNAETMEIVKDQFKEIESINSLRGLVTSKAAGGIYQPDAKVTTKSGVKRVTRQEVVNTINEKTELQLDSLVKANMADLKALAEYLS